MALDLNALRAKLSELNNKTRREDVIFKPVEGENIIRVVPLKSNPSNPFQELYFHYIGRKTTLSPITYGEPDPIEQFYQSLRSEGNMSKEEYSKAREFLPKLRTYVPVVVRGKESEGVRYWGFGKTTYAELISIMSDPDYGDITDVNEGHDIKITFTPAEKSATGFAATALRVSPKKTPLTKDADLRKTLLNDQPDLFDVFPRQTQEQLSQLLENYLNPKKASAAVRVAMKADDSSWDEPEVKKAAPAAEPKKSIEDDFEEVFNQ